ncbi:glycosyltransferase family 2 protein [Citrobacter rodentium]|jgi:Glycosyltransferases involved in cell wall biogenesis|uniref:Glycosyltransferase n=2 Tax=Citrobacter rodentium TaxID=67825 RepID=D2TSA3_CITRI|nr:glycosyltransferase family 2 protein [Citrobacter rodentium]KIQ49109.1 glycosyltransferase [Citrobacter rodentium]QBY28833.1 glycosyltransferase family 2 protein [Citrobacter rodentium]UHO29304.1 glycosyltransferase [Citrobacter rodentium NBRC 105723 = DSM 16636]CBG89069.1 putative glycosyltransferase [Citrobacter rodentium ICC168]HAT8013489.1 glycosyltransferase family 2 protein [Citrobacter rodentium NBRC 105723 = DSM 16636]
MDAEKSTNSGLPDVSIIVPAYNSAEFIHVLLDSLAKQTDKNFEVIVVDDGSTDNTGDVVNHYKAAQTFPVTLIRQQNAGVSSARNTGMDNACGEFCIFIDSDDFVSPDFIEKLLSRQEQTQADIVYCGYHHGQRNGTHCKPEHFYEGNLLTRRIRREIIFHLGGVLIRRSLLVNRNLRFNTQLALGEDLLFTYSLLAKERVYSVPEYLYHQTYRKGSVMNSSWSLLRYEHNASAMELIHNVIVNLCPVQEKKDVSRLLKHSANIAKIKYIWQLLAAKEYEKAMARLNLNYLNFSSEEVSSLQRKDRKKYKIINSKNKFLWATYFFIRKSKHN